MITVFMHFLILWSSFLTRINFCIFSHFGVSVIMFIAIKHPALERLCILKQKIPYGFSWPTVKCHYPAGVRSRHSKGKGRGNWVRALLTRLKSPPQPPPPLFERPPRRLKFHNFLSLKFHDSPGCSMNERILIKKSFIYSRSSYI